MPEETIRHNALWVGKELLERSDWQWSFDAAELVELEDVYLRYAQRQRELVERSGVPAELGLVEDTPAINASTPRLLEKMVAIRESLEQGSGAVRLSGFPLSHFVDGTKDANGQLVTTAAVYWSLMSAVGVPVPQTANGNRLFRVQDEGLADNDPRARGPSSRKRLSFHTDRCDVISFLCLRRAVEGGENQLVSSMAIYQKILADRPDLLDELCRPYYYQRHNVDPANENAFYQQPIFSSREGAFACSFLRVLIERAYSSPQIGPMSDRQREAIDCLESTAEDERMHVRFLQEPGDILLLNNYVTLHRRNEFVDDPQQKRLLLRLWLAVPNSRPLDESYRNSYGAVDAGAIRGGMKQRSDVEQSK